MILDIQPTKLGELAAGSVGEPARRRLVRTVAKILGSEDEAEDVVQEALVRLMTRGVAPGAPVGPWLVVVARRLAIDVLRARKRLEALPEGEAMAHGPLPDEISDHARGMSEAMRRLGALGEDQ